MQHSFSSPHYRPLHPQSHGEARRHTTPDATMTETETVKALRPPLEIPTRPGGTIQARRPLASGRIEVSNDQSIRDSQSPRRLPDSGGGFSQPEENAWSATTPTLKNIASSRENPPGASHGPPLTTGRQRISATRSSQKSRTQTIRHSQQMCRKAHRRVAGEAPGSQKAPGGITSRG